MRILLISPSQSQAYGRLIPPAYPHLGLGYLAAVLEKAAHEVKIIDIDADKITREELVADLQQNKYGIVGITTTTPTFNKAIGLSQIIKENSKAWVVLGGIHVSLVPEDSIKHNSVDFIIKGEGELTIVELAHYLEAGGDINSIDGLYYKNNGQVFKNRERRLIDNLDELPFPAWHLFKSRRYTYPDALFKPVMPVITSRGCPGSCAYCTSRCIFTSRFRARSPKNILTEIEYLIRQFGAKEIHVWDDNFITQRQRVFQLRDEIKKRNIKINFAFPNGLRPDYISKELLNALKDMGAYSIAIGVDSGNQNILDSVKRSIGLEKIEYVFRLAKEIGLETWGFFMIGLPADTEGSIRDTIDFAIKLNPDVAKFHILKPFPGSEVYKELLEKGLLFDNDFDHFGIHTPPVHRLPTLSSTDLLRWHKRAYRNFYLRPSIIIKQIMRLKSFTRIKLNICAGIDVLKSMY